MTSPANDITLGEVYRLLVEVRKDVREMREDVGHLKTKLGIQQDKVGRLEKIVYGAGALATAGFVTALWAAITGR